MKIRPLCHTDISWVLELFSNYIGEFYDGDPIKHAQRLVTYHFEDFAVDLNTSSLQNASLLCRSYQRLYVAQEGSSLLGLVNLSYKLRNIKLSPLLVDENYRKRGVGSSLLAFSEKEACRCDSYAIYCSVSENNTSTLSFFFRKGFNLRGRSLGLYREGEYELFLSKRMNQDNISSRFSFIQIKDASECVDILEGCFSLEGSLWKFPLLRMLDFYVWKLVVCGKVQAIILGVVKKGGALKISIWLIGDCFLSFLFCQIAEKILPFFKKVYLRTLPHSEVLATLQEEGWEYEGSFSLDEELVVMQFGHRKVK